MFKYQMIGKLRLPLLLLKPKNKHIEAVSAACVKVCSWDTYSQINSLSFLNSLFTGFSHGKMKSECNGNKMMELSRQPLGIWYRIWRQWLQHWQGKRNEWVYFSVEVHKPVSVTGKLRGADWGENHQGLCSPWWSSIKINLDREIKRVPLFSVGCLARILNAAVG